MQEYERGIQNGVFQLSLLCLIYLCMALKLEGCRDICAKVEEGVVKGEREDAVGATREDLEERAMKESILAHGGRARRGF